MKYIMFFGSIGVGKTTIGKQIEQTVADVCFIEENLEKNVFLSEFYKDMKTYAFRSTLEMLLLMKKNYERLDKSKGFGILDNGVEELICYNNYLVEENILSLDEFGIYKDFYNIIQSNVPRTDLYVYFTCGIEEQLNRIQQRGRTFEQDIDEKFLSKLNAQYEKYIQGLPKDRLWIVDTSNGFSFEKFRNEFLLKMEML